MPQSLDPATFVQTSGPILDVRSPGEFAAGHIPSAVSFPLFSDDERAQVGICYKQQGRDQAVELGFAIAGPKFAGFVSSAKALAADRQVRIYCWRGGMRSGAIAWVLDMGGLQVSLLEGGYKAFRRWGRHLQTTPIPVLTLGGMTGTGKTDLLTALAAQGEQVLDLEGLASHRGSSYGSLGLPPQPSNEQFENRITVTLARFTPDRPVWIEAESRRIGLCRVPDDLFQQMVQAPILQVLRTRQERLDLLVQVYGEANIEELVVATKRIQKRLGGLRTQQAVELLRQKQLANAFDIVLDYYDQTYQYDLARRQATIYSVDLSDLSAIAGADVLRQKAQFYCPQLYAQPDS